MGLYDLIGQNACNMPVGCLGGCDGLGWVCLEGVVCGRRSFPPGPKPRLVDTLGESDLFGLKLFKPIHCVGGGYSKQASPLFRELVVNDFTPGPGSVGNDPTSWGRGWRYGIPPP